MDVHDVTAKFSQKIANQRLMLQKAKKKKGQRPHDRRSREQAYTSFMLHSMIHIKERKDMVQIHSSFIPPAYLPCTTPVAKLRKVCIADLQLETHHRGDYLILRSITPPSRLTAIFAIMEDETEDAILVQLYQQEDEVARKAADIIDVGTTLLIKEPYFKVMGDGEYGLRVDHLSDVVSLKRDDIKVPLKWKQRLTEIHTAEGWKLKGNVAMGEDRHRDAITM